MTREPRYDLEASYYMGRFCFCLETVTVNFIIFQQRRKLFYFI